MTYETYQIPENHIRTLQKAKAAKLTVKYINEHGEEPPANVKAGFMDISEKEYEKYRKTFFAIDYSNGMTGEGAIINTPDERPKTRYNEFFQCVYYVTDVNNKTQLFKDNESLSAITYAEIDGVSVDINELEDGYQFDSIGTHRFDFLMDESINLHPICFSGCTQLREVSIPEIVQTLGYSTKTPWNVQTFNCPGLYKITCYSTTPPNSTNAGFENVRQNGTLYVPKGSAEQYENSGWKKSWTSTSIDYGTRTYTPLVDWKIIEMDE